MGDQDQDKVDEPDEVEHTRKTRQRDHLCHCGKSFQVRQGELMSSSSNMFQFSWSLKNHIENDHEGKDLCCEHCNKMFENPLNLRKHLSKRICQGGSSITPSTPVTPAIMSGDGEEIYKVGIT